MKQATDELEGRDVNRATKRQQFVMTSTNNLALLLSEILEQMQKQLDMPPSKCNKPKNCNKPNPNCNKPSMSEIKKAQKKLNNKMKEGKNGQKGKIDKILENMEENERDIINNQITKETINRQQDILTRLLETENSDREREKDDKRKATEWEYKLDNSSEELLKYKKLKKKQEELLKTTPLQLTPFYKKKVNSYFNNIIND